MIRNNEKFRFTQHHFKKNGAGFTLVELLIYTAIFIVAAGLLTSVLVITTRVENTEIVSTQVGQELNLVLDTVQRLVKDASLVEKVYEGATETNPCATFCSLKLRMKDSTLDPTVIRSTATAVYLKQGANPETTLTSNHVVINNLKFTKFDIQGGHATVQVDASLTYNSTNPALQISKTLRSAVGRVSAATFDSDLLPDSTAANRSVGASATSWKNLFLTGLLKLGTFTDPDPANIGTGSIYYNTTRNNVRVYNSTTSTWNDVSPFVGGTNVAYYTGGNVGIGTVAPGELLSLGLAGTTKGVLSLAGNTSGKIIIQPAAAAGTYTLTLPTAQGAASTSLQNDGAGNLSWVAAAGGGQTTYDAVVATSGGDYTDIQSAVNAGKKTIFVRKGTYTISSAVTITSSDVNIIGEDRDQTIIFVSNGANIDGIIIGDGTTAVSGVVLRNLTLNGNKANQTAGTDIGISIKANVSKFKIDSLNIGFFRHYGISTQGASGMDVASGGFTANLIHDNGTSYPDAGLFIGDWYHDLAIVGNSIYLNRDNGLSAYGFGSGALIKDNYIYTNNARGILVSSAERTIVANNTIYNNNGEGIFTNTSRSVFSGNTFRNDNLLSSATIKTELMIAGNYNVVVSNSVYITGTSPAKSDYGVYESDTNGYNNVNGNTSTGAVVQNFHPRTDGFGGSIFANNFSQ